MSEIHPASFRDPSGFVFFEGDQLLRQVNPVYQDEYRLLHSSGLYQALLDSALLIQSEELLDHPALHQGAYKVLKPEQVRFISYPYEWSFSQLKDAAITTLEIEAIALEHGMSLKDASAYNIQFVHGAPQLIDSLSFEKFIEGEPWVAYNQFCRHFLAPLALSAQVDARLVQLLSSHIDGIPLDLTSRLLPWKSRLQPGLGLHIHTHAASIRRFADSEIKTQRAKRSMSKHARMGLIDSLKRTVQRLEWDPSATAWSDYTLDHYTEAAHQSKLELVEAWIKEIQPATAWDLGANTGEYSRIAANSGAYVVALDSDPGAVEINYRTVRHEKDAGILPLVMDLTNPSPGLGWASFERSSLIDRGPADLVMALALIHHLAISNNVPLPRIAEFFANISNWLILEFVPKEDEQAQKLFASREDIFDDYTPESFLESFSKLFELVKSVPLPETQRSLYLFQNKGR